MNMDLATERRIFAAVTSIAGPVQTPATLRVVCAWCTTTMQDGPIDGPISHGICAPCETRMNRELDALGA